MNARYWETDLYRRRAAELRYGCDMTIAMAAFVPAAHDCIVTVSDARLSYGEMIPAADGATMKNRRIGRRWGMMFAAEDATAFFPVLTDVQSALSGDVEDMDDAADFNNDYASKAVREAYENELNQRFFQEKLAKLGYADIAEFRKNGFAEMGKDLYHQYSMDLAKYDLGLELLCYGFNKSGDRFIFEEANPGKVIWHNTLGYAAIGSGSLMALAALNRKPLVHNLSLNETIYRLLDAKFSSETARDVGKKTYLIMLNSRGKVQIAPQPYVERIRNIWDDQQKKPEPPEALEVIAEITDPFITPENSF